MSIYSAKVQAYLNYINDLRQFSNMPLWQRQLAGYNNKPVKPVTLPPVDRDTAHKALNSLPPANYYSKSCNIDDLDDFIWSIT